MVMQYVGTRTRLGSLGAQTGRRALTGHKRRGPDIVVNAEEGIASSSGQIPEATDDLKALPESFCIIESRNNVMDFASMQLEEIKNNIQSRRNRIFLLMEEVRRLRIQQRLKDGEALSQEEEQEYSSTLPFLPPLTDKTKTTYFQAYGVAVGLIIMFGGLIAPILQVRLGVGGTTYREFIDSLHLPGQLAEVDPIVAAFCGGAVGAISALLFVEFNNIEAQVKERCTYCEGSGYLTCGSCSGSGIDRSSGQRCAQCSGTTKVMCTACLCTGKKMATEHDPRFDPFE